MNGLNRAGGRGARIGDWAMISRESGEDAGELGRLRSRVLELEGELGRLRRRRRVFRGILIGGLVLVMLGVVAGYWGRREILTGFAGTFRRHDPAESDFLVLLLGGLDHRPAAAAALHRAGLAPRVLLCEFPDRPSDHESVGFTERHRLELVRHGVPAESIAVLPGGVAGTRDEASRVREYCEGLSPRPKRVTVVTTAFHSGRAGWIFERTLGKAGIETRVAAVAHPEFTEENWFRVENGVECYLSEALKVLFYRLNY